MGALNIDVREALKSMDASTARGRAILKDKAINLEPNRSEQAYATQERLNSYLEHSRAFARTCEDINKGLKEEELEQIEFIREQFEKLARITLEELIRLA